MQRNADPRLQYSRHILYNLSQPEKSLQLLAPLALSAGGHARCGDVFPSREDADYRLLLAGIEEARAHLRSITRFTMPGFRPDAAYLREMKRYGVLPADHRDAAPIDVYTIDRRYWESHWHRPAARVGGAAPSRE
jgi:hypothetical protein